MQAQIIVNNVILIEDRNFDISHLYKEEVYEYALFTIPPRNIMYVRHPLFITASLLLDGGDFIVKIIEIEETWYLRKLTNEFIFEATLYDTKDDNSEFTTCN